MLNEVYEAKTSFTLPYGDTSQAKSSPELRRLTLCQCEATLSRQNISLPGLNSCPISDQLRWEWTQLPHQEAVSPHQYQEASILWRTFLKPIYLVISSYWQLSRDSQQPDATPAIRMTKGAWQKKGWLGGRNIYNPVSSCHVTTSFKQLTLSAGFQQLQNSPSSIHLLSSPIFPCSFVGCRPALVTSPSDQKNVR